MPVKKYMKRKSSEKEPITQKKINFITSQSSLVMSQKLAKVSRLRSEETKCNPCEMRKLNKIKQSSNCPKNSCKTNSSNVTVNKVVSEDFTYNS